MESLGFLAQKGAQDSIRESNTRNNPHETGGDIDRLYRSSDDEETEEPSLLPIVVH